MSRCGASQSAVSSCRSPTSPRAAKRAGDDVLKAVGQLLKAQLRSHRDVAARLGGEEFAVLCFGDIDEELTVAERIRDQINKESINCATGAVRFTASFGFAIGSAGDNAWRLIYARADSALYEAKAAGKDRVKFGELITPGATGRFRSARAVRN